MELILKLNCLHYSSAMTQVLILKLYTDITIHW
jgi:hypothetical protein